MYDKLDAIMILYFISIVMGMILPLIVIYSFIKIKSLRKQPGDILVLLAMVDFMSDVTYTCTFFENLLHPDYYDTEICEIIMVLLDFECFFPAFLYISFCLFINLSIKNSLKKKFRFEHLNIVSFILAMIFSTSLYFYRGYN